MTSVLIQQASGSYTEMLDLTHDRHKAYCKRHSFSFIDWRGKVLNHPQRGPTWCRIELIRFALRKGFEFVVCLDADTLIVDMDQDFREALPEGQSIGMVKHPRAHEGRQWHWNCGVMVVRNGLDVAEWFGRLISSGKVEGQAWNEQSRVNDWSLRAVVIGQPEPYFHLDDKWNSADHINPCEKPVVKAWHGYHMAALPMMKDELEGVLRI